MVQEDQALKMIAELESCRLASFREEVQNLECHIEALGSPLDPTNAWKRVIATGGRKEVLQALIAQPYLAETSEEVVARLAEDFGGCDEETGRQLLKALPLRRSKRRSLLSSKTWLVHLCSGRTKPDDPLLHWCDERNIALLNVDLNEPGGKGWDLTKRNAVWRVLMWAAASGRVAAVFASPPRNLRTGSEVLCIQDQVLWSLASVARGVGVPYVREVRAEEWKDHQAFLNWSGSKVTTLNQAPADGEHPRATCLLSNLNLGVLGNLSVPDKEVKANGALGWSMGLRRHLASALSGRPAGVTCEVLDSIIRSTSCAELHAKEQQHLDDLEEERLNAMFEQESVISSSEEESEDEAQAEVLRENLDLEGLEVKEVKDLSETDLEGWRRHLLSGHVPYRRDCRQCVEGAALGTFHTRVRHPRMYTLSIDLFGPVPVAEAGRDETCVTGKCTLRYGLVGGASIEEQDDEIQSPVPEPELFPELFDGDLEVPVLSAVEQDKVGTSLFDTDAEVLHTVENQNWGGGNGGGSADALMERWTEAKYGAPHRTIPKGHVLITPSGNLEEEGPEEPPLPPPEEPPLPLGTIPMVPSVKLSMHCRKPNGLQQIEEENLKVESVTSTKGIDRNDPAVMDCSLSTSVVEFDARLPHAVHKFPDWLIVGYTPLGTAKIPLSDQDFLRELGFRYKPQEETVASVRAVSWNSDSHEEEGDTSSSDDSGPPPLEPITPRSECSYGEEEQEDSVTQPVGWDVSTNGVRVQPALNLEETDFYEYLVERDAEAAYQRLTALGVQEASDEGIHPAGTVRPDAPNLTALTTGEVQLIDRTEQRWIDYCDRPIQEGLVPAPIGLASSSQSPQVTPPSAHLYLDGSEYHHPSSKPTASSSLSENTEVTTPPLEVGPPDDVIDTNSSIPPSGAIFEVDLSTYEDYAEYCMHMQSVWEQFEDATVGDAHGQEEQEEVTETLGTHDPESTETSVYQCKVVSALVVHNVSPAEVKKHLEAWTPAATAEVSALEGMRGIKRLKGRDALRAAAAPGTQILPAKTVFTVKPGGDGSLYRRKCRVVGCGNYEEKDPSLELYASGVPSEVLRAILIECAVRKFLAFITDVKNAFLLAPLPADMNGKILLRPPKVLEAMGITEPNEIWEVCKAVYGLRQSPRWWSEYRDSVLRTATWNGVSGCEAVVLAQSTEAMLEMVDNRDLDVDHCPGDYQLADLLTKGSTLLAVSGVGDAEDAILNNDQAELPEEGQAMYRSDSRDHNRSSRPKARAQPHTPEAPQKENKTQLMVDDVLQTVRSACDSIEDHAEELGTTNALKLLADAIKDLQKEDRIMLSGRDETPTKPTSPSKQDLTPQYSRKQMDEAQRAVQSCVQMIQDAFRRVAEGRAAGAATQLSLCFDRPPRSAKEVALRLQSLFHGNPTVPVEYLAEEAGMTWQKPAASAWFAEKGGDARKVVFRIHVPARATFRKASKMSLQFTVESRTLTIQSTKVNLIEFAAPLVAAFGPVGTASPLQGAAVDIDVSKYLPRR
ncbi:GIP [Symbiodinium sp. CCMP2592]|nr:GIP [Symbiodinium sp. CCMP2592]